MLRYMSHALSLLLRAALVVAALSIGAAVVILLLIDSWID